jgi:hypothetical protein
VATNLSLLTDEHAVADPDHLADLIPSRSGIVSSNCL